MSTSEEIFREAMMQSPEVRAELAERLIGSLAEDVSREIAASQFAEVQRRIAKVETGEAELVQGDKVLARAQNVVAQTHAKRRRREM